MPKAEKNFSDISADISIHARIQHREILSGLEEIAAYTGLSISTIRRAIKHNALPASTRSFGGKIITSKSAIHLWIKNRVLAHNLVHLLKKGDLK